MNREDWLKRLKKSRAHKELYDDDDDDFPQFLRSNTEARTKNTACT
jgi:hypothetical protein